MREAIEKKHKEALNFDEAGLLTWRKGFEADALRSITPWFKAFLSLEPKDTLTKVVVPVLALNGDLDTQVSAKQQLPAIEDALKAAGDTKFEMMVLPKLNHQFQTCVSGSPSEYGRITETISPIAIEAIRKWLLNL